MKTKNIIIIISCLILVAFILGATGIIPIISNYENKKTAARDTLIGAIITNEPLISFNYEDYVEDNIDKIVTGKANEYNSNQPQARIYAELVEKNYEFKGIKGICFFNQKIIDETSLNTDQCISDIEMEINKTDENESFTLKGTIYRTLEQSEMIYFNPVYQTESGEVYAENTSLGEYLHAGDMTLTLKDEKTHTSEASTSSNKNSIEIKYKTIDKPISYTVLQFSRDDILLDKTDYTLGSLPKKIKTKDATEYIVVERLTITGQNKQKIKRQLYQKDEKAIETFIPNNNGTLIKKEHKIIWPR